MPPRPRQPRRLIRQEEQNMLHEMYNRNGALWDVIVNDVRRDERFQQLPEDVRVLYNNAAERAVVRRRVRDFIGREQRQLVKLNVFLLRLALKTILKVLVLGVC